MTYLNDVPDGGTQFKNYNLTVKAKKGKTVLWPSDFTHTHKSEISKKYSKYIVTGWMHFPIPEFFLPNNQTFYLHAHVI